MWIDLFCFKLARIRTINAHASIYSCWKHIEVLLWAHLYAIVILLYKTFRTCGFFFDLKVFFQALALIYWKVKINLTFLANIFCRAFHTTLDWAYFATSWKNITKSSVRANNLTSTIKIKSICAFTNSIIGPHSFRTELDAMLLLFH